MLWDNNAKNGSLKSENHWHLNRKNCKWGDPNVIQAIMNAMGVTNVSIPADDDVVEKKTQTISGTKTYTKTYGDKSFALNAKTVSGGGALSYKSSNEKVVTVDGKGNVTVKGAGTAKITVTASENAAYKSATMEVTVKVNAQQLTNAVIQPIADQVYGGSAVKPKVTVKSRALRSSALQITTSLTPTTIRSARQQLPLSSRAITRVRSARISTSR